MKSGNALHCRFFALCGKRRKEIKRKVKDNWMSFGILNNERISVGPHAKDGAQGH